MKEVITITKEQFADSIAKAIKNLTEDAPKEIALQLTVTCIAISSSLLKELFDKDEESVGDNTTHPEAEPTRRLM